MILMYRKKVHTSKGLRTQVRMGENLRKNTIGEGLPAALLVRVRFTFVHGQPAMAMIPTISQRYSSRNTEGARTWR